MILFVGGAPRVGKSLLAQKLSQQLNLSYCSTDDLRWGAKQLDQISREDPLFISDRMEDWKYDRKMYEKYSTHEIVKAQIAESKEVIKIVKGFVESLMESKRDFILEGVALMPQFVTQEMIKQYEIRYFCVGNTDFESFVEYAWKHRVAGDWLEKTERKPFEKVIQYCSQLSEEFKKEAQQRKVPYFELRSAHFNEDMNNAVKTMTESVT